MPPAAPAAPGGLSLLLLLLLLLLVACVCRGRSYLLYRLKDFFSAERSFASPGSTTAWPGAALICYTLLGVGCVSGALILAACFPHVAFAPGGAQGRQFLVWVALVVAVVVGKGGLHLLGGWVFFDRGMLSQWLSHYFLLTAVCALPLYPLAVCLLQGFVEAQGGAVWGGAVLILYEILLFYRLRMNFPWKGGAQMLIFVYLCTLEIPPLLIGWRFLASPSQG